MSQNRKRHPQKVSRRIRPLAGLFVAPDLSALEPTFNDILASVGIKTGDARAEQIKLKVAEAITAYWDVKHRGDEFEWTASDKEAIKKALKRADTLRAAVERFSPRTKLLFRDMRLPDHSYRRTLDTIDYVRSELRRVSQLQIGVGRPKRNELTFFIAELEDPWTLTSRGPYRISSNSFAPADFIEAACRSANIPVSRSEIITALRAFLRERKKRA